MSWSAKAPTSTLGWHFRETTASTVTRMSCPRCVSTDEEGRSTARPGRTVDSLRVAGLHRAPLMFWTDRLAYAITESGGKPGQAYNAVRQVLSAVDGYARDFVDDTTRQVVRVTVPIVVTAAPLVTCRLDDAGSILLEEVERVLLVGRLRPAAALAGVWIVRDSALNAVAADARKGVDGLTLRRNA